MLFANHSIVWIDGTLYQGDIEENLTITGKGTLTYLDGRVYTGDLLNNKRQG